MLKHKHENDCRMKIILISKQSLAKTYSGACRSVHEEIKYFNKIGYEVHTISEDPNVIDLQASGAIIHKIRKFPWQNKIQRRMRFAKETDKLAKKLNVDLLIGHGDCQYPDIHFVHNCVHLASERIHGEPLSPDNEMYKIHTPIFKKHQFKHLVANSYLVKKEMVNRFNIPPDNISVIYPAVDSNIFKKMPNTLKQSIRNNLGVSEDEYLLGLITSGDFKKRGVDRFLESISLLPYDIANKCHFIIVGKDKLPIEYQAILNANPYKERIRFLPVIEKVEEYYNALDIFVLPAKIEEFGRVVAEAMSCGTPVITTYWVGASELMHNSSADFVYSGEDNAELSTLIVKLLTDKELRTKVGNENMASVSVAYEKNLPALFDKYLVPHIR